MKRNECLSYSWRGGHDDNAQYGARLHTIVTWTLTKVDGGTRLRLVHSSFVLPKNDAAFRNLRRGWKKVVARIQAVSSEQNSITQVASRNPERIDKRNEGCADQRSVTDQERNP